MILAHKIALDPTAKQREYFIRAASCDRLVWNIALAEWNRRWDEFKSGESKEYPNGNKISKDFNTQKYEAFPWMEQIHRDAHSNAFKRVHQAWSNHFKNPENFDKPVFHKKGRKESFYVANDQLRIEHDELVKEGRGKCIGQSHIKLPVIGRVRMTEGLRFNGKIMGAVVSQHANHWFVAIQVEVGDDYAMPRKGNGVAGMDLGIKIAAMIVRQPDAESDEYSTKTLAAMRPLRNASEKIVRLQRSLDRMDKVAKAEAVKEGKDPKKVISKSNNRRERKMQLGRAHKRAGDIRNDLWNKETTRLCSENQAVGIEDLNVAGMVKNHKLARSLFDVGMGMCREKLEYKAKIYGTKLIIADQWFPSSKICSRCGYKKDSLSLRERIFHCDHCGLEIDRDENAAINLMQLALLVLLGWIKEPKELTVEVAKEMYPRLAGNQRLGRGRAVSSLEEPGTKTGMQLLRATT